jgi:hypothetical protein
LNTSSKVFLSSLIRNRARILPDFLKRIESLHYPKKQIRIFFLLNDSTDSSEAILKDWKERNNSFSEIRIKKVFLDAPPDVHGRRYRVTRGIIFQNLAKLHNIEREEFLKSDANFFFGVDSDVLLEPESLKILLSKKKDCITIPFALPEEETVGLWFYKGKSRWPLSKTEIRRRKQVFKVSAFSGGIWLFSRKLLETIAYDEERTAPEHFAFSDRIREAGFEIWVIPKPLATHEWSGNEEDYPQEEIDRAIAKGFVIDTGQK